MGQENKKILAFDVETTGLSPQNDFIIQLSAKLFDKETFKILDTFNEYIIPQHAYNISPDAERVHGISKEFLEKNGKSLIEVAPRFLKMCEDADYLTYNGNKFDVSFCHRDFGLAGFEFPIEGHKFYDSYAMECRIMPRDLENVFQRYMHRTMEDAGLKAHDSMSDVGATICVFREQMKTRGLTFDEIDEWEENNMLSPEGSIRLANKPGEPRMIVFRVGKHKDEDVYEVMKEDASYLKWASEKMFTPYTLNIVREYCREKMQAEKK